MAVPLLVIALVSAVASWVPGRSTGSPRSARSLVYGLGAIGLALRDRPAGRRPWFAIPAFFCLVNIASLHALANLVDRPADRPLAAGPPDRADAAATERPAHDQRRRGRAGGRPTSGAVTGSQPRARSVVGVAVLVILGAMLAGHARGRRAHPRGARRVSGCSSASAIILRPDVATLTTIAILYSNAAVVMVQLPRRPGLRRRVRSVAARRAARARPRRPPPAGRAPHRCSAGWSSLLFIHLVSALFSIDLGDLLGRGRRSSSSRASACTSC